MVIVTKFPKLEGRRKSNWAIILIENTTIVLQGNKNTFRNTDFYHFLIVSHIPHHFIMLTIQIHQMQRTMQFVRIPSFEPHYKCKISTRGINPKKQRRTECSFRNPRLLSDDVNLVLLILYPTTSALSVVPRKYQFFLSMVPDHNPALAIVNQDHLFSLI